MPAAQGELLHYIPQRMLHAADMVQQKIMTHVYEIFLFAAIPKTNNHGTSGME